jgi:hypothetical protein
MAGVIKKLLVSLAVFTAFYMSGYIALFIESYHQSLVTSSAVFGISFVSILGGGFKLWYDIFG